MRAPRGGWVFPAACLLAVATLLGAYSNSFDNAFHFDDSHAIEKNFYIRSLTNIPRFFRDPSTYSSVPLNISYRPLVSTTFALDYWMGGGLDVRQFHLTQLTMLVLLGILLYVVYLPLMDRAQPHRWNRYAALVAASLYGVHTAHTETMNIIQVRSELLSALGILGSFLVYFYVPRSRRAHLYLLPMVVGTFAKPTTVMFAPLFLVYLLLFEERLSLPDLFTSRSWPSVRAALWKSLPACIVGVGVFLFTNAMEARAFERSPYGRLEYFLSQCFAWLHYGRLFFLPVGLTADPDSGLIAHWYDTRVVAGVGFAALLLYVVWSRSKTMASRPVAFGVAWFGLTLLPSSSIIPLVGVTSDHRPFLSYMGLSLAVVWGTALLVRRWYEAMPRLRPMLGPAACVGALLAVGGHAVGTYARNKTFLTEEALWRDVTAANPANARAQVSLAVSLIAQDKYAEANEVLERARVYAPDYGLLEINLGVATLGLGQPDVAERHFLRALKLTPGDPMAHSFYGRWLGERGRLDEAMPYLQRALSLSPADPVVRYALLEVYARTGRTAELKTLAAETLALQPGDPEVMRFLNLP